MMGILDLLLAYFSPIFMKYIISKRSYQILGTLPPS
jgi:hypothetical protein